MSGTLAALTAQQFVTTGYQAWTPYAQPPDNPPGPPNAPYGVQPQTRTSGPIWHEMVLVSWIPADPLPTLPVKLLVGTGATLLIQGNSRILWQASILSAWVPPDPLPTIPTLLGKVVTKSGPRPPPKPVPGGGASPPGHVNAYGATPVYSVPAVGTSALFGGIVPAAGVSSTITQGGTPIAAVIGPCNGGYITNPFSAASQGIVTSENCYVDMVNFPGSTDATGSGTTSVLAPGGTFTIPAIATGVTIWVNAATSGHALTIVTW